MSLITNEKMILKPGELMKFVESLCSLSENELNEKYGTSAVYDILSMTSIDQAFCRVYKLKFYRDISRIIRDKFGVEPSSSLETILHLDNVPSSLASSPAKRKIETPMDEVGEAIPKKAKTILPVFEPIQDRLRSGKERETTSQVDDDDSPVTVSPRKPKAKPKPKIKVTADIIPIKVVVQEKIESIKEEIKDKLSKQKESNLTEENRKLKEELQAAKFYQRIKNYELKMKDYEIKLLQKDHEITLLKASSSSSSSSPSKLPNFFLDYKPDPLINFPSSINDDETERLQIGEVDSDDKTEEG
jgi:hypothetical protein